MVIAELQDVFFVRRTRCSLDIVELQKGVWRRAMDGWTKWTWDAPPFVVERQSTQEHTNERTSDDRVKQEIFFRT